MIRVSFFIILLWAVSAQAQTAEDLALVRGQHFTSPDEFAHYHGSANNEKALQNKHHKIGRAHV